MAHLCTAIFASMSEPRRRMTGKSQPEESRPSALRTSQPKVEPTHPKRVKLDSARLKDKGKNKTGKSNKSQVKTSKTKETEKQKQPKKEDKVTGKGDTVKVAEKAAKPETLALASHTHTAFSP